MGYMAARAMAKHPGFGLIYLGGILAAFGSIATFDYFDPMVSTKEETVEVDDKNTRSENEISEKKSDEEKPVIQLVFGITASVAAAITIGAGIYACIDEERRRY